MNASYSIVYTTFLCLLFSILSSANNEHSNIRSLQTIERNKNDDGQDTIDMNHHSNLRHRRTAEWMGYPRISPQPRIINGDRASTPDRYPYFVALVDDQERMVCGGSLIASNVVLSAAHCGLANLKFAIVGKYYGQIDIQHNEAERIPIANTYKNPRFTLRDRSYDQLLVLLEAPASDSRPVVRLNLAQGGGDASLPSLTDRVTVLGLGQTYSSSQPTRDPPEVLQQVTMGVVSNRQCQDMYDEYQYFLPSISNDMVCLLEEGKGQCYGDSGGPYVLLGDKPEDDIQIGTVAWGIDCAREEYPAVGIRTYSTDDSFLRDTTCAIAINPPSYFGCPTLAPQPVTPPPTVVSSAPPSTTAPTIMDSDLPTTSSMSPTPLKSEGPSSAPSSSPSVMASGMPSFNPSGYPSMVKSDGPSALPSTSPSAVPSTPFPTASPTTCIARANACSSDDVCCGTDVCQGGFCRRFPDTSKQSGYKNDLKLTRTYTSDVRGGSGSFQSIGIAIDGES